MSNIVTQIQAFDFSVDTLQAIIWEYDSALNIKAIVEGQQNLYDIYQTEFWDDWITDVFDLRTANNFGLAVWSIILNQSLYTSFIETFTPYFGFGSTNKNFENGNFASLNGGNNVYSTETARLLLRLRYFQLTSSGTVPEINRMLKYLFGGLGGAYLTDNLNMTQTYNMLFEMSAELSYMLNNTDILPRPAGVLSTIVDVASFIVTDADSQITTNSGSPLIIG
jgi:Protein of unknown function (DUF2612)